MSTVVWDTSMEFLDVIDAMLATTAAPPASVLVVWHGISVTYSGCGQAASVGSALSWAAMRSSRAFRSFLVNFHSNGVAICS